MEVEHKISPKTRFCIIGAALIALFLGAMDALVMSVAMPTIGDRLRRSSFICLGLFSLFFDQRNIFANNRETGGPLPDKNVV